MNFTRVIAAAAFVAAVMGQTGQAQNLRSAGEPAEFPPSGYKGTQYVDSKGCVYIRAGISGNVSWVPRVSRNRKQICGQSPTLQTRTAAATAATAAKPPVQITVDAPAKPAAVKAPVAPKAKAKAKAAAKAKPAVAKPAKVTRAAKPVVRKAPRPAPVTAAAPPAAVKIRRSAPVQSAAATLVRGDRVCGVNSVSRRYINLNSGIAVRCGPQKEPIIGYETSRQTVVTRRAGVVAVPGQARQARRITSVPQGIATGGTVNSGTRIVPRHVYLNRQNAQLLPVPDGYRKVWEDDRLNPRRAEQTVGGVLRANYLWTNTVPRRLLNSETRQDMTAQVPLIYPYLDVATQQRELGEVTIVQRDGKTMKRIVRNKTAARQPMARQPVVSTRSAPLVPKATGQRVRPAEAGKGRYVQVGTFGQESNARATAQRVKSLGLPVRVGKFNRDGKTYRLVLAGPFSGSASGPLAQVRRAGFADAFIRK